MSRIPDPPADFAAKSYDLTLRQIMAQYRLSENAAKVWLLSLTPHQQNVRLGNIRAKASAASHRRTARLRDQLTPDERQRERERQAERERDTLAQLIADAAVARQTAPVVDRYAGLTGFDRQLAVAADRGVVERRDVCRPVERSLTGSTMALFQ